ncbi:histidinol-phosphate transaminase [Chrysiogenes arsenatis]|uniref:histidinol-phosphate transaminase n=1 Tax=Chrysiogenes arsenatis TaxID=309797 RepID=UPI00041FAC8C|nr:histidinol-phosphate transaminase [Chrysiogenes arsenatis]
MRVSKNIEELIPYQPGKPIKEVERELGVKECIKLASNENPFGTSPKALQAVTALLSNANRYPEGGCFYLKQKLAKYLGVAENSLVFGNGSNEIIELLIRTFVQPGEEVLYFDPSFAVYPIIAKAADRDFRGVPLRKDTFEMNPDDLLAAIQPQTKVIFLTTPNNPVGNYIPRADLEKIILGTPQHIIIAVDEAYIEYATEPECQSVIDLVATHENVIVLRTFSKAYGLSGYRIGYSVSSPQVADYLNRVRQPFNVNLLAQTAAEAALDDDEFLAVTLNGNSAGMNCITNHLRELGISWVPSQANFILIDARGNGADVFQGLLREGVIVRHIPHPMIRDYIRVTIGTAAENKTFLTKFEQVLRTLGRL